LGNAAPLDGPDWETPDRSGLNVAISVIRIELVALADLADILIGDERRSSPRRQ
jgi:hypothetical protein